MESRHFIAEAPDLRPIPRPMIRALKQDDILELSKLYESEFNKPHLHDRVLIFDVVALRRFSVPRAEVNVSDENEAIKNEASEEDVSHEMTTTKNVETGVNTSDASQNCEIATNGWFILKMTLSFQLTR